MISFPNSTLLATFVHDDIDFDWSCTDSCRSHGFVMRVSRWSHLVTWYVSDTRLGSVCMCVCVCVCSQKVGKLWALAARMSCWQTWNKNLWLRFPDLRRLLGTTRHISTLLAKHYIKSNTIVVVLARTLITPTRSSPATPTTWRSVW